MHDVPVQTHCEHMESEIGNAQRYRPGNGCAAAGANGQTKHHVNVHVGRRLRQCRLLMGLSLQELADRVGLSYQQLQKYELGENRISVSRLWEIAQALEVPATYFLEELDSQLSESAEMRARVLSEKEAVELVQAYYAIPEEQRRRLLDLAQSLGDTG